METIDTFRLIYESFLESNQTVSDFCRQHDIPQSRFFYWQRKLRKASAKSSGEFVSSSINNHSGTILSDVLIQPLEYDYKLNDENLDRHVLNEGYEYLEEQENPIGQDMDDDWRSIMTENESLRKRLYATSFVEMARRGFYSFDKTEDMDGEYHLVAYPSKGMSDWHLADAFCVKGADIDFANPDTLVNIQLVDLINKLKQDDRDERQE